MNESPLHFLPQDLPLLHSEGCSHFPPAAALPIWEWRAGSPAGVLLGRQRRVAAG